MSKARNEKMIVPKGINTKKPGRSSPGIVHATNQAKVLARWLIDILSVIRITDRRLTRRRSGPAAC